MIFSNDVTDMEITIEIGFARYVAAIACVFCGVLVTRCVMLTARQ